MVRLSVLSVTLNLLLRFDRQEKTSRDNDLWGQYIAVTVRMSEFGENTWGRVFFSWRVQAKHGPFRAGSVRSELYAASCNKEAVAANPSTESFAGLVHPEQKKGSGVWGRTAEQWMRKSLREVIGSSTIKSRNGQGPDRMGENDAGLRQGFARILRRAIGQGLAGRLWRGHLYRCEVLHSTALGRLGTIHGLGLFRIG